MRKNRSVAIDIMRLLFALIIVMFHARAFYLENPYFKAGNMAVEFFFVLSGFLMNRSIAKEEATKAIVEINDLGDCTLRFIVNKFKNIYPYMLLAYCIIFLEKALLLKKSLGSVIHDFFLSIWELLLLREGALSKPVYGINDPTWYLSGLLISMLILYPLMRNRRRLFGQVMAPLIAIFLISFLMQNYGTVVRAVGEYDYFSLFGLKRAIAELCVGIFCYQIYEYLYKYKWNTFARFVFVIIELAGYGISIAGMYFKWYRNMSPVIVLLLGISIILTFLNADIIKV